MLLVFDWEIGLMALRNGFKAESTFPPIPGGTEEGRFHATWRQGCGRTQPPSHWPVFQEL